MFWFPDPDSTNAAEFKLLSQEMNETRTMRFNPHAFKRLTETPAQAVTDVIAATTTSAAVNPLLAAFLAAYGRPGANQIPVPEGSMAVTLSLKFNDSAPQVDHFEYHAPTGCPAFLVLLVKKQAQTENLARKALTACPELHNLDWWWKSEKYGGGHGNYLLSSAIDLPVTVTQSLTARHTFSGQPVTRTFWEIQFATAWRGSPLQLWPHKHYGAPVVESSFSNGRDTGTNNGPITAAWCLNERMRGVEIHFTRRPDDAALAPLRGDRAWRYTGKTKCWYARQTPETIAWAKTYCENFNGGIAMTPPVPAAILPSLPAPAHEPAPIPVLASPAVPPSISASPARPERKFIRYSPTAEEEMAGTSPLPGGRLFAEDPEAELQSQDDADAEREVLQREYANSQGRAEFYEANPPDSGIRPTGFKLVSTTLTSIETPKINIADLMRPKV